MSYSAGCRRLLDAIAGYHDGARVTLFADSLHIPDLAGHEQIHDRIVRTTPDGYLLLVATLLVERPDTPAPLRSKAYEWRRRFFDDDRFAHECAATYLAITQLDREDVPAAVAGLDTTYHSYYSAMDRLIAPITNCSYLAYLLGQEIAYASFSSTRLADCAADECLPLWSEGRETASSRMRKILSLEPLLVKSYLSEACKETVSKFAADGMALWNLEDDVAWASAPNDVALRAELSISSLIRQRLKSLGTIDIMEVTEQLDALRVVAGRLLPKNAVLVQGDVVQGKIFSLAVSDQADLYFEGVSQGHSRIVNTPSYSLQDFPCGKEGEQTLRDIIESESAALGIVQMDHPEAVFWILRRIGTHGWAPLAAMAPAQLADILGDRAIRRDAQNSVCRIDAILVASRQVTDETRRVFESIENGDRAGESFLTARPVFAMYLAGAYFEVLERLTESGVPEVLIGEDEEVAAALRPTGTPGVGGASLRIVLGDVPLMRIVSHHGSVCMFRLEHALDAAGHIRIVKNPDRLVGLRGVVEELLALAYLLLPEL